MGNSFLSTDGAICFMEFNFISTVKVVFGLPTDLFFFSLSPSDFMLTNLQDIHYVWLYDSHNLSIAF